MNNVFLFSEGERFAFSLKTPFPLSLVYLLTMERIAVEATRITAVMNIHRARSLLGILRCALTAAQTNCQTVLSVSRSFLH